MKKYVMWGIGILVVVVASVLVAFSFLENDEKVAINNAKTYIESLMSALEKENITSDLTCNVQSDGNLSCGNGINITIETNDEKPTSGTIEIKNQKVVSAKRIIYIAGSVDLDENGNWTFEDSNKKQDGNKLICEVVEAGVQASTTHYFDSNNELINFEMSKTYDISETDISVEDINREKERVCSGSGDYKKEQMSECELIQDGSKYTIHIFVNSNEYYGDVLDINEVREYLHYSESGIGNNRVKCTIVGNTDSQNTSSNANELTCRTASDRKGYLASGKYYVGGNYQNVIFIFGTDGKVSDAKTQLVMKFDNKKLSTNIQTELMSLFKNECSRYSVANACIVKWENPNKMIMEDDVDDSALAQFIGKTRNEVKDLVEKLDDSYYCE